jgi:hypothetical protein
MRRLQTIGFGLVMSLAAVGTARAGVLEHQTLKGKAADLEFLISTPETCADGSEGSSDESVSLFGEESLITSHVSGRTLINALSAIVVFSDSCTGSVTILVGQVEGGFNSLTPRRATLNATVPLTDISTGAPAGTLVASATLQGGNTTAFTNEHDKITFPDGTFRTDQIKSTTRAATVSGSVKVGGVEFIGHLTQSLMFDNRDSVTDIAK